jgi:predicted RNase H-like HicB family nuclease
MPRGCRSRHRPVEKLTERRDLIVIEGNGESNYSAYSPDVPGAAATGPTREDCEREMREAIAFHVEGLAQDGEEISEPLSTASYAVVQVA